MMVEAGRAAPPTDAASAADGHPCVARSTRTTVTWTPASAGVTLVEAESAETQKRNPPTTVILGLVPRIHLSASAKAS